ncbi:hypothetical protein GEV33_008673 [Tenebrio molitor]|uniref:Uncharacterized protein n=1 Tax=Tenebrio molitor TaxID=7067 RepID=A0A8J6L9W9_TENMO|nr:hypothetical protein GEV33_008673 [Tenebrio molitor]
MSKCLIRSIFFNGDTEHRGQALSARLCIRKMPGSKPGAATWVFFKGFSTPSQMRRMVGQHSPPLTSLGHRTIPNLPVIVVEKVLESLGRPLGMKNCTFTH